jgi:small redox-active disulfide protein 2
MEKKFKIEVLGPGCKNCEDLFTNVLAAVEHAGIGDTVQVSKVKNIDTFIKMGVFSTPALVIDGKVASTSQVLSPDQVIESLKNMGLC